MTGDLQDIKDRLTRLEERSDYRDQKVDTMSQEQRDVKLMVQELVADLHRRQGQEAIAKAHHVEDREDSWQRGAWLRALLPVGIIAGAWTLLWQVIQDVFGFGGGQ